MNIVPGAERKSSAMRASGSPEDNIDAHHAIGSPAFAIVGDLIHASKASCVGLLPKLLISAKRSSSSLSDNYNDV